MKEDFSRNKAQGHFLHEVTTRDEVCSHSQSPAKSRSTLRNSLPTCYQPRRVFKAVLVTFQECCEVDTGGLASHLHPYYAGKGTKIQEHSIMKTPYKIYTGHTTMEKHQDRKVIPRANLSGGSQPSLTNNALGEFCKESKLLSPIPEWRGTPECII